MFGDDTLESIRQQIRTPLSTPKAEPKFNAWGLATAIPRGIGEAGAQVMATGTEVAAALRYMRDTPSKDMEARGVPFDAMQSDLADSLRDRGREFRPDPETAHAAEQVLYGFARGAGKVVGGAMLAGPGGVVAAGIEEGVSAADDLKRQGVTDPNVRAKAGMVQGAGLALAALPVVGQTAAATAGLYAVGGPGGFMAQQALTRKILADAGHGDVAAQFDPLDPVGLAVSALIPGAFAVHGIRGQRKAAAAKADAELIARATPGEQTGTAGAVRDAYSPEVVDAARVAYAVEQRAAANPQPWSMRSADVHEQALSRAEDAIARGEPVQVADLIPEITPAQREANFAAWFGDSKVVGEDGKPLVVYHGTAGNFDSFDIRRAGASIDSGKLGEGFYFTQDPRWASKYAENAAKSDGSPSVAPVHVSLKNPLLLDGGGDVWSKLRSISREWGIDADPVKDASNTPNPLWSRRFTQEAMLRGHDGVILPSKAGQTEYVAFSASQIKSATGNSGRYDPHSASLTDPLHDFAAAIDQLRQLREPDAAPQAQPAPPAKAPEPAAPQGKPRDLRTELIALRKEQNVLNKLLECLNG